MNYRLRNNNDSNYNYNSNNDNNNNSYVSGMILSDLYTLPHLF